MFFLSALAIQVLGFAHFLPQIGSPVWGSYSFERVAFLGRMRLLLSPGLRSWHALPLSCGCSEPPGYTLTRLPLVSGIHRQIFQLANKNRNCLL